jgi:hypothetical protein
LVSKSRGSVCGDVRTKPSGVRNTTQRDRAVLVPKPFSLGPRLSCRKIKGLQTLEAKVPIPATRKSPVEDTLLPEMCNCGVCAIRITWQSTTLKQTRSAGRATRPGHVTQRPSNIATRGPVLLVTQFSAQPESISNTINPVASPRAHPVSFLSDRVKGTGWLLPLFCNDTETIHLSPEAAANSTNCHTIVGHQDCYRTDRPGSGPASVGTPVPLPRASDVCTREIFENGESSRHQRI